VLIFIADFFEEHYRGGAEHNDAALINLFNTRIPVLRRRASKVTLDFLHALTPDHRLIIANHCHLAGDCVEYLAGSGLFYLIYEHDYHYIATRNPCLYPDLKVPESVLINTAFYQHAQAVLCQSDLHASITIKTGVNQRVINLATNFWKPSAITTLRSVILRGHKHRSSTISIIDSNTPVKNTKGSIHYCEEKGLDYILIPSTNYHHYLELLSSSEGLAFFPLWPESFSRITFEAACLGLDLHVSNRIGALSESWFTECLTYPRAHRGIAILEQLVCRQKHSLEKLLELLRC